MAEGLFMRASEVAAELGICISSAYKLIQNLNEELGFLGNLDTAGLAGPFQEKFYQRLVQLVEDRG